jgi:hypothetical protein
MALWFSGRAEAWAFKLHIPIAAFDFIAVERPRAARSEECRCRHVNFWQPSFAKFGSFPDPRIQIGWMIRGS